MAELLPLVLGVKAANWRPHDSASDEADAEFQLVRKKILDRDDQSCRFCGFRTGKYQEVHHVNDDHHDNRPQNLVTACMFCHSVHHIGFAGSTGEAVLSWLPEISQPKLAHLVRAILVALRHNEAQSTDAKRRPGEHAMVGRRMAEAAKALEQKLREGEQDAQRLFGTADPTLMANILLQMTSDVYDRRAGFLRGLRLLPLGKRLQGGRDTMPTIVDTWISAKGPYCSFPPRAWLSLLKQYGN